MYCVMYCVYMFVCVYENMAAKSRQKYGGKVWDTTLPDLSNSVGDPCNGYCTVAVSKAHGLTNYFRRKKGLGHHWSKPLVDRQMDTRTVRRVQTDRL